VPYDLPAIRMHATTSIGNHANHFGLATGEQAHISFFLILTNGVPEAVTVGPRVTVGGRSSK